MEQVVAVQVAAERVDHRQAGGRSVGHRDGDGPVQLDHGGRLQPRELRIPRGDPRPVRVLGPRRSVVERRDLRLDAVRPARAERRGPIQERESLVDRVVVPSGTVLVLEQHEVPGGIGPGRPPAFVQDHQREQPLTSGSSGSSAR